MWVAGRRHRVLISPVSVCVTELGFGRLSIGGPVYKCFRRRCARPHPTALTRISRTTLTEQQKIVHGNTSWLLVPLRTLFIRPYLPSPRVRDPSCLGLPCPGAKFYTGDVVSLIRVKVSFPTLFSPRPRGDVRPDFEPSYDTGTVPAALEHRQTDAET